MAYRCEQAIIRGARDAIRCKVSGTVCAHQKMCLMEGRIVLTDGAMRCPARDGRMPEEDASPAVQEDAMKAAAEKAEKAAETKAAGKKAESAGTKAAAKKSAGGNGAETGKPAGSGAKTAAKKSAGGNGTAAKARKG